MSCLWLMMTAPSCEVAVSNSFLDLSSYRHITVYTCPLLPAMLLALKPEEQKKKKPEIHYIFSRQLRADQIPSPPQEGQPMCTLFQSMRQ